MATIEERSKEALDKITPILKELMVDIGSQAFIDGKGAIQSQLVWVDATSKSDIITPPEPAIITG